MQLLAERVLYRNDELLFVSCETNSIFSLDLKSGDVKIRYFISGEENFESRLFGGIFEYNNKYVLVPANSSDVVLLDKKTNEKTIIKSIDSSITLKYMAGLIHKDRLFMFNHGAEDIRCISLEDYSETILNDVFDCFFFDCYEEEDNVLLPSCNSNIIIRLNLDTLEMKKYEVGKGKYNCIENYNGDYYLGPREGNMLTIWKKDKEIIEVPLPRCNAIGVIKIGETVILPSNVAGGSLKIASNGDVVTWHPEERFILAQRITNNMYVLMNDRADVYVVDLSNEHIAEYKTELKDDEVFVEKLRKDINLHKGIMHESRLKSLSVFLDSIVRA